MEGTGQNQNSPVCVKLEQHAAVGIRVQSAVMRWAGMAYSVR
jgi:hypothetical protein